MSWRTVVISNSAKLDYKMGYMIVRQDKITKIHISEIAILLIESTAVSFTASLLAELKKQKVKVIFCDEKRNPSSELIPYYGSHDTSSKIRTQVAWEKETKRLIWTEIVSEKIRNQKKMLEIAGRKEEALLLQSYLVEIEPGDATNREGHAAKVYFNGLFGRDFSRTSDVPFNAALNYGYGILLSAVNREIVSNGYITQLGLFHDNMFNQFNLGSDLMEPFRVIVDRKVFEMEPEKLEHEEKMALVNLMNLEVRIEGKKNFLANAIKTYCRSVFDAVNDKDISLLKFIQW
nr:type II CRISPR-associated endonuclease Cas1 [uncultured Acetatifactor sp.]